MIWIKDIKEIWKTLNEAGKIKEYQMILELQQQLLEMQSEISELKEKNKKLKEDLSITEKITYKNNAYYNWDNWPFCSRCWDKEKNLIRIIPRGINDNYADCPECKNYYNFTWKEETFNITPRENYGNNIY